MKVRVLTFNLRIDVASDLPNHWTARLPLVGQLLELYQPDLMGFQELFPHQLQDLTALLPGFHWTGNGRDPDRGGEGCYLFWRDSLLSVHQQNTFWLAPDRTNPAPAWDACYPRICNEVILQTSTGARFQVYNVHLDHVGQRARLESLSVVREARRQRAMPTIVLGDFNLQQAAETVPALADLMDAHRCHASDQEGTFHAFSGQAQGGPIDYIFVSSEFQVDFTQRLTDCWNGRYPSDHFGLLADLHLSQE